MPKARPGSAAALAAYPRADACRATTTCSPRTSIDDGERLWIIDYEYAGNNDPCFELGQHLERGHPAPGPARACWSPPTSATSDPTWSPRARLYGLMSKYGWTLWASIQHATSTQDFDFWAWGMQKYDRAVAEFDGPDFERLLDAAEATHRRESHVRHQAR